MIKRIIEYFKLWKIQYACLLDSQQSGDAAGKFCSGLVLIEYDDIGETPKAIDDPDCVKCRYFVNKPKRR